MDEIGGHVLENSTQCSGTGAAKSFPEIYGDLRLKEHYVTTSG